MSMGTDSENQDTSRGRSPPFGGSADNLPLGEPDLERGICFDVMIRLSLDGVLFSKHGKGQIIDRRSQDRTLVKWEAILRTPPLKE